MILFIISVRKSAKSPSEHVDDMVYSSCRFPGVHKCVLSLISDQLSCYAVAYRHMLKHLSGTTGVQVT